MIFRYLFPFVVATNDTLAGQKWTLVATSGENRCWVNFSCFLDYSYMKSISVYDNYYISYTFKMILIDIWSLQVIQY